MSDFLTLAKARYSCRQFSDAPVTKEELDSILAAVKGAPSAHNDQPYRIWICESEDALARIRQCTKYHFHAPLVLIVGYKKDEAWVRPYDEKQFGEVDAAIVGAHILFAAHDIGLGSTWVAYYEPAKVAELFPETEGYEVLSLFPIGHPSTEAHPAPLHTVRRPEEELIFRL